MIACRGGVVRPAPKARDAEQRSQPDPGTDPRRARRRADLRGARPCRRDGPTSGPEDQPAPSGRDEPPPGPALRIPDQDQRLDAPASHPRIQHRPSRTQSGHGRSHAARQPGREHRPTHRARLRRPVSSAAFRSSTKASHSAKAASSFLRSAASCSSINRSQGSITRTGAAPVRPRLFFAITFTSRSHAALPTPPADATSEQREVRSGQRAVRSCTATGVRGSTTGGHSTSYPFHDPATMQADHHTGPQSLLSHLQVGPQGPRENRTESRIRTTRGRVRKNTSPRESKPPPLPRASGTAPSEPLGPDGREPYSSPIELEVTTCQRTRVEPRPAIPRLRPQVPPAHFWNVETSALRSWSTSPLFAWKTRLR